MRTKLTAALIGGILSLAACSGSNDGGGSATAAPRYEDCYSADALTSPDVAGHRCTWLHEALLLQERLDRNTPLGESQWHSTHNSFNAAAYTGVGYFDFNQQVSIRDQLTLGIRKLELDAHWYQSDAAGTKAPVLCHAQGADLFHVGCTSKARPFADGVAEIVDFLAAPENEDAVVIVGVEDVLEEPNAATGSRPVPEAHDEVVAIFESLLGDELYRPPADGACHPLPLDLTKNAVRAAGARVVLASGCGAGDAWPTAFFDETGRKKGNDGFTPYPDCESAYFSAEDYATKWTRVWQDSTFLSSLVDPDVKPIDAETLAAMRGCPLNEVALDQLRPDDARATAMVWSWAPGEPRPAGGARCASSAADGHFVPRDCAEEQRAACRVGGEWRITEAAVSWAQADDACVSELGATAILATPTSGFENQRLGDEKRAAAASQVWLGYRDAAGQGRWELARY